jgi:hypothetical protein
MGLARVHGRKTRRPLVAAHVATFVTERKGKGGVLHITAARQGITDGTLAPATPVSTAETMHPRAWRRIKGA